MSVKKILRRLVREHPRQWDFVLSQVEFSYNGLLSRSTEKRMFQILYGMNPKGVCELRDLGKFEQRSNDEDDFVETMRELHEEIKQKLKENNHKYKQRSNSTKREVNFEVWDMVLENMRKEIFPRGEYKNIKMNKIIPCIIIKTILQMPMNQIQLWSQASHLSSMWLICIPIKLVMKVPLQKIGAMEKLVNIIG